MATISEMEDARVADERAFRRSRTMAQSITFALWSMIFLLGSIVLAQTFHTMAARSAATTIQIEEGRAKW